MSESHARSTFSPAGRCRVALRLPAECRNLVELGSIGEAGARAIIRRIEFQRQQAFTLIVGGTRITRRGRRGGQVVYEPVLVEKPPRRPAKRKRRPGREKCPQC